MCKKYLYKYMIKASTIIQFRIKIIEQNWFCQKLVSRNNTRFLDFPSTPPPSLNTEAFLLYNKVITDTEKTIHCKTNNVYKNLHLNMFLSTDFEAWMIKWFKNWISVYLGRHSTYINLISLIEN